MTVTFEIPDSVSDAVLKKFPDPQRAAAEAFVAKAYATGCLGLEGVRKSLGLSSRWEAEALLKQHDVWPGVTEDDVKHDLECLDRVLKLV